MRLNIGGVIEEVGLLARSWNLTNLNEERSKELDKFATDALVDPSPKAAIVGFSHRLRVGPQKGVKQRAHLVIGWDYGRSQVWDKEWDYLPVLGYAIQEPDTNFYVLHELRDGTLYRLEMERATQLGLIDSSGSIVRRGQPEITDCRSVRLIVWGVAEADCTFDNHRTETLMIGVEGDKLPDPSWLVGKRPMDAANFPQPH